MQNRRGRPGKLATAGEPGRTELLRLPDTQILDREGPRLTAIPETIVELRSRLTALSGKAGTTGLD